MGGNETERPAQRGDAGMTLVEVMAAFLILTTCAVPLLVAIGDAQRRVFDEQNKRIMKQLLEYKLAHILLDRPGEDEEPIYVDGAEGNFGEDFDNDPDKTYWHDKKFYNFEYRIDSEEVDLGGGAAGGVTGQEEYQQPEPEPVAAESPFGALGGEQQEEELGQLRYRVTLTVFYRPGNASFDKHMSIVTYVRHPHQAETMTGPAIDPGLGGVGGGEAQVGGAAGGTQGLPSSSTTGDGAKSVFESASGGGR